jgi:hypothetical protein
VVGFLIEGFSIAGKALSVDEIYRASGQFEMKDILGGGKSRKRPLDKGELEMNSCRAGEGEEGERAPIVERVVGTGRYLV